MATPGAEFVTVGPKAQAARSADTDTELRDLEKEIAARRDWPLPSLLMRVVEGVSSITLAHGAAIALRDQWGVVCRASRGEAPEVGSRLRPDSALTRECFETGQVVVCDDTESDDRVRRSTANNLQLRSAVVVPLQNQGSVLGVIEVLSSRPSAFSPTQVAGLQRIAQLLAGILAAAPAEAEIRNKDVLADAPSLPQGLAGIAVAPAPTVAPPKQQKSTFKMFLVAVAAILLLLLLMFLAVPRPRRMAEPSPPTIPRNRQTSVLSPSNR